MVPRLLYTPLLVAVAAELFKVDRSVSGATFSYELLGIASTLLLIQIVYPNRFIWWIFAIISGLYLAMNCVALYNLNGEVPSYAPLIVVVTVIAILSIHRLYMQSSN